MSITAETTAATIIERARSRKITDLSNLKLQKLLYYAQAWNLVFAGKPLFSDACEAWVHGPAVARVFGKYKSNRWSPITEAMARPSSDPEIVSHIDTVLAAYGSFSATDLERLTHQETPWREARVGLQPDAPSRKPISTKTMKEFYSSLVA